MLCTLPCGLPDSKTLRGVCTDTRCAIISREQLQTSCFLSSASSDCLQRQFAIHLVLRKAKQKWIDERCPFHRSPRWENFVAGARPVVSRNIEQLMRSGARAVRPLCVLGRFGGPTAKVIVSGEYKWMSGIWRNFIQDLLNRNWAEISSGRMTRRCCRLRILRTLRILRNLAPCSANSQPRWQSRRGSSCMFIPLYRSPTSVRCHS